MPREAPERRPARARGAGHAPQAFVEDFHPLDSRKFVMAVRKLADSLSYGIDRSPFVGSGIEYAQSRPYVAGDPVRAMDWRVTARTQKHHVKEYETPKTMPTWLLVDTSASMAVGSRRPTKYEVALQIAGGLALAALDRVSPVGVLGVGERALRVRPSMSRTRVMQWLLELRGYRFDESTELSTRIAMLAPSLPSRSLLIALTDLHDEHAVPALKRLAQRNDVVVIELQDASEAGVRGAGFVRASEAETGREFAVRAARRWVDPEPRAAALSRAGIDRLAVQAGQPFAHALRQLFKARGGVGRGTR